MFKIKVATGTLNQIPFDWKHNYENIIKAINLAREQKANLLSLPELCVSGYGCEDAFFYEDLVLTSHNVLNKILKETEDIILTVGLPVLYENSIYNGVAVAYNKKLLGIVLKQELAGDGIYYEPRWFKKWKKNKIVKTKLPYLPETYIGDIVFDISGFRVAIEVCEDAWNGVRPATDHYLNNADIIINPSASNFSFGKSKIRLQLVLESSRAYKCTYLYTNLLGNEAGRIIFDGEMLIAQNGDLLNYNPILRYDEVQVITSVVDISRTRTEKRRLFNFEYNNESVINYDFSIKAVEEPLSSPVEYSFLSKEEEFFLAETLALFDYMRKSYSKGFVLSLSGGADSSTCAVLCHYSIRRAYEELPEDVFYKKLNYWKNFDINNPKQYLFCVYQRTKNNSEATYVSAERLANELGAEFHLWDVQSFVDKYEELVEDSIARELSWDKDDISRQNLQARVRVPALWMIANLRGALLITTSNRSESAVGYATMDGDTAGGLAPLAGVDKNFILNWLKWAKNNLNLNSLDYVINLKPSAELRPKDKKQTDEKDLMPYSILDKIERYAIHEYRSPIECFELLVQEVEPELAYKYVVKFFRLWSMNQWKRERFAPSFHLDDANLDPKTWFRFPILNGGYKYELDMLKKYYKEKYSS